MGFYVIVLFVMGSAWLMTNGVADMVLFADTHYKHRQGKTTFKVGLFLLGISLLRAYAYVELGV